jgi:hypothetical protein
MAVNTTHPPKAPPALSLAWWEAISNFPTGPFIGGWYILSPFKYYTNSLGPMRGPFFFPTYHIFIGKTNVFKRTYTTMSHTPP